MEWTKLNNNIHYRCDHFDYRELVDEETANYLGESLCWALLNGMGTELLIAMDWLRINFGRMTVNNWHYTRKPKHHPRYRQWSGVRLKGTPYYRYGSAHSGNHDDLAFDVLFNDYTAQEVRDELTRRVKEGEYVPSAICRIEDDVSWLHVDSRPQIDGNRDQYCVGEFNTIYFFKV